MIKFNFFVKTNPEKKEVEENEGEGKGGESREHTVTFDLRNLN